MSTVWTMNKGRILVCKCGYEFYSRSQNYRITCPNCDTKITIKKNEASIKKLLGLEP